ncbi:hypothetical protein BWZ22_08370 [Seonamhaeicola sp. S2-3]|uniref:energy transducer TonB n=1 Tax=Seonamhaeicola sp. S2-3 TaxID=1936081 RepID=UPI000972A3B7|nr:energy transducer TonB [Seonamhaeicola sp. S2-3]APY11255.1 hypothetical protein BWZ22_08370 [Seonamhaeicola sp. S2-3]
MKNQKHSHSLIRQNEQTVKKSQKHDANLQKNSTLYFQLGLIVCLLVIFGLFEMKFETKIPPQVTYDVEYEDDLYVFNDLVKPKEEVKKKEVKRKEKVHQNPVSGEEEPISEDIPDIFEPPTNDTPFNPDALPNLDSEPEDDPIVDFVFIEEVPIYPGCENKTTNLERKKCMSDKLSKLIRKKFDTSIGDDLGLSGRQTVLTQFTIDTQGNVIDVKTRAPHPELTKEAQRVINKVPKMKPGKQRDKPVKVRYTLPIIFQVQN